MDIGILFAYISGIFNVGGDNFGDKLIIFLLVEPKGIVNLLGGGIIFLFYYGSGS